MNCLSGLIYIQDDLVWSLYPLLFYVPTQDMALTNKIPWLELGPVAEMQLAHVCLTYILTWWENIHADTPDHDDNEKNPVSSERWAFLSYSVGFWHQHYSQVLSDCAERDKVNTPDLDGWTPLHWACRQGNVVVIRCIVQISEVVLDRRDNKGWGPWDVAVLHGNTYFASKLGRVNPVPDEDGPVRERRY